MPEQPLRARIARTEVCPGCGAVLPVVLLDRGSGIFEAALVQPNPVPVLAPSRPKVVKIGPPPTAAQQLSRVLEQSLPCLLAPPVFLLHEFICSGGDQLALQVLAQDPSWRPAEPTEDPKKEGTP